MDYFLAIDIGASSGRHILGHLENGRLELEEVHRFPNDMKKKDGQLYWDTTHLFEEIITGMKKCAEIGKTPVSVGIDTWGVDFVLLDKAMNPLGPVVAYRDKRTDGMIQEVEKLIPEAELYARTGIQKLVFNTIYQLMAVKHSTPDMLEKAHKLLFMPDYLHYMLSGVAQVEYTIATTSALVNAESRTWDDDVIAACGLPRGIFGEIVPPGTVLGGLTQDVQRRVGYNCQVITPASHDTKSAIMAVPADCRQPLFISSGTWSIMGVERPDTDCTEASRSGNFTNEGGYGWQYCHMRNIMGLWMIQCVKKELGDKYSFAQLCEMAEQSGKSEQSEQSEAPTVVNVIDVNDNRFLAPDNMIQAIQAVCAENGHPIPREPGELAAVIYNSLAISYRDTAREIEALTGKAYDAIYIVGGGAKAEYLNGLTRKHTGKTVYAGPSEATAIGNLAAQMIACGVFANLQEARACVRMSLL